MKNKKNVVLDKFKKSIQKLIENAVNNEKREEKIKNEQKKLVLRDSYYRKNDFESVFVRLIKMKTKMEEKKNKNKGNEENYDNDDYIEEEEDEEDEKLNLVKIKSGVYEVKDQSAGLRSGKKEEKTEKEPQDNIRKNIENKNISKNTKEKNEGPKDSVKK